MSSDSHIDPRSWWRDPLGDAIKDFLNESRHESPCEPYWPKMDERVIALFQLELLLQAKVVEELVAENYVVSPIVRSLSTVLCAVEDQIIQGVLRSLDDSSE